MQLQGGYNLVASQLWYNLLDLISPLGEATESLDIWSGHHWLVCGGLGLVKQAVALLC